MSNNFSTVPNINISRSKFTARYHHKTSFNMGKLIPFDVIEVLPGDTFKLKMNEVCRISSALVRPIMDNLFLDVYYFFVPNRLSMDKWAEVMGENKKGHWVPATEQQVYTCNFLGVKQGSLADYFGLPLADSFSSMLSCSMLPFNAYALIWNEYFRDENNQDPVQLKTANYTAGNLVKQWSPTEYIQAYPAPVCKLHDYFTSALPAPQKGEAVKFSLVGDVPVVDGGGENLFKLHNYGDYTPATVPMPLGFNANSRDMEFLNLPNDNFQAVGSYPRFSLKAQTSDMTVANVNDLRFAFQLQKMLEKDARGGTRYREYLQSHFGVTSPDSRMQVPEFLGGARLPVSIEQVEQTTPGEGANTVGQVGAYSLSNGRSGFTKGFVEHGFVIGVLCVRQHHTYQQGLEKFWTRKKRTDFYDPVFANIGEQPIYQSELFYDSENDNTKTVFGYQEAWADYRYKPSRISGELRSTATNSMDIWHLGDNYANAPILGNQFLSETTEYLDRSLAVPSTTSNQFIIDIYTENEMIRPMPVYSVPGLIDHH
ncbi:VP1 [Gokushovirinae sp.]|nr:VP1 [Gokushovirinae sp.]